MVTPFVFETGLLFLKKRLKEEKHGIRVRTWNRLLAQYFPEMDQHFGSVANLNAVQRCCLDPSLISMTEYDDFAARSPWKLSVARQRRLTQIWRAAEQSIGCCVGAAVSVEAQIMVAGLQRVRETIKTVDDKIEDISLKKVLKMAGLDLSAERSGKKVTGSPVISKKGKADLRYALYQAALRALLGNKDFMAYYNE